MRRRLIIIAALLLQLSPAEAAPVCTTPQHGQFDFWVGHWAVSYTGKAEVVAESLIEKLHDGCAIRETWKPKSNAGGGSLSAWRPQEGVWRQVWLDKDGAWVEFKGGWTGAAMVLTGDWPEDGKPKQVRMTYTRAADGSVRQLGEESLDGGRTWSPGFDFTYRRKP